MVEFLVWVESWPLSTWVRESGDLYGYPMILFLHTLCLSAVVGGALIIALRLLGIGKGVPIRPLERLYPMMWIAFAVNATTGLILVMQDATYKLANPTFYIKMVLVFAGVAVLRLIQSRVFSDPNLDKSPITGAAKGLAVASLVCWLGALTAGRLLAYLGPVAGLADF